MNMISDTELNADSRTTIFSSPAAYYALATLFIALLILIVYYPIAKFPSFLRDDFSYLSDSINTDQFWGTIMSPLNEHLTPLFRALLIAEFQLFGGNPAGYYWTNIAIHILNSCLVLALYNLIASDKVGALCAGILFGVSASYWRAVMWITEQCVLMNTLWFLIATLFFLLFLNKKQSWMLLISSLSHFLMLMSFSAGVEVPLLYAIFILFLYNSRDHGDTSRVKVFFCLIPYCVNIGIYFMLRYLFIPVQLSPISAIGGFTGFINRLPIVFHMMLGGIYHGYLKSFTGLYRAGLNPYVSALVLFIIILLVSGSSSKSKKRFALLACMAVWLCLSYLPPILFRVSEGYWEIVTKPRYRYLPGFAATTIAILIFRSFWPFTRADSRRIGVFACWGVFVCIVLLNISELRRKERFVNEQSHHFERQVEQFLGAYQVLSNAHRDTEFGLLNEPFRDESSVFAGWNVYPSQVIKLYLHSNLYATTKFISEYYSPVKGKSIPLYRYSDGNFVKYEAVSTDVK